MERVFAGWLVLVFWSLGAIAAPAVAPTAESGFQQLDAEVEQVLNDVVLLGAEMAILEESRELSPGNQLLVVVSVAASNFFKMDAIHLKIDNRTVSYHQYNEAELDALAKGGSHRLFWDDVPPGRHQLSVSLLGRVPKDPGFQREATQMITTGAGRRVVELRVASGKNQAFPELSVREWK